MLKIMLIIVIDGLMWVKNCASNLTEARKRHCYHLHFNKQANGEKLSPNQRDK